MVPAVLFGSGNGLAFVPLTSASPAGVRPEDAGAASGLSNVTQQLGGALGLAVPILVVAGRGRRTGAPLAAEVPQWVRELDLGERLPEVVEAWAAAPSRGGGRPHRPPPAPPVDPRASHPLRPSHPRPARPLGLPPAPSPPRRGAAAGGPGGWGDPPPHRGHPGCRTAQPRSGRPQ